MKAQGLGLAVAGIKNAFAEPFEIAERSVLLVRGPLPVLIVADNLQKDAAQHESTWLLHTGLANRIDVNAAAKAARITGGRKGGICDVQVVWTRDAAISQVEARDPSDNSIIAVTAPALNPRFVVVLAARAAKEEAVAISATGDPDSGMILRLNYPEGSAKDIEWQKSELELRQSAAADSNQNRQPWLGFPVSGARAGCDAGSIR